MDKANFKASKEFIASEGQEIGCGVMSGRKAHRGLATAATSGIHWGSNQLPLDAYIDVSSFGERGGQNGLKAFGVSC